jgi:hypothetical protein
VRRMNVALVIIALLALAGAGTGIGLAASATGAGAGAGSTVGVTARVAASSAAAAARKAPGYVVADCFQLQVRPSSYVFSCADGGSGLAQMHWTTWSSKLANGYGAYYANDCIPNCADGHSHRYPALVVLWGSARVKGHPGLRRYAEFTLIFTTSKRPPVYHLKNGKTYATYPLTQTFEAQPLLG